MTEHFPQNTFTSKTLTYDAQGVAELYIYLKTTILTENRTKILKNIKENRRYIKKYFFYHYVYVHSSNFPEPINYFPTTVSESDPEKHTHTLDIFTWLHSARIELGKIAEIFRDPGTSCCGIK